MEIQLEPLRQKMIFFAMPVYGGMETSDFAQAKLMLTVKLRELGIPHMFQPLYNESLIPRARDFLADLFIQSPATHLMFIDADISFDPMDVVALLHYDKPVIGGVYPMKKINWEAVKKAVLANPDIDPKDLAKAAAYFAAHLFKDTSVLNHHAPLKVRELATGFMMINKEVFLKLESIVDPYTPNDGSQDYGARSRMYDFFPVGVHSDTYESEDYSFCRIAREAGFDIWACPWMKLGHTGTLKFEGSLSECARMIGEIH